ncbi:MAG: DUF2089 family protein [Alphaproteobacteria bacterium]
MVRCAVCKGTLEVERLACRDCGLALEGAFRLPRLLRLSKEHLALAEAFLLAGGSIKDVAAELDISYPTLRKRLDELIESLATLRKADVAASEAVLQAIEHGEVSAARGLRQIKEINGDL